MSGKLPGSLLLVLILTACAGPEVTRTPEPGTRVAKAVASPLSDLNLLREKIPQLLLEARDDPYRLPADLACDRLALEVQGLDRVLGPDLDAAAADTPGLLERGSAAVGDAAFDALRGAAESLVPYRSWVRKLTGAERHSKEVAASIAAGIVRRSYLKGIGQHLGCMPPAAPSPKAATLAD